MNITEKISHDTTLKSLLSFFESLEGRKVYLVGGFLRDIFLNAPKSQDYDLVVVGGCSGDFGEEIARELCGTLVELDLENDIYRVVADGVNIDITCTKDIFEDAKRRDFTLNSIYYDFSAKEIFDPLNGLKDLQSGILKTHKLENFDDDPLRMLRAFRFVSCFDLKLSADVLEYIKKHLKDIKKPAPERLRVEIVKMFGGKNIVETLLLAYETGFLAELFPFVKDIEKIPRNSHHHLPLLGHSIETVKHVRTPDPLLKLAAFMHDIGKPQTWKIDPKTGRHRFIGHEELGAKLAKPILEKLKFSRKQVEFITKMIANHIYPSALMHDEDRSQKALIRFAKKIRPHTKELLELARADRLSARGEAVGRDKVDENLKNLETLGAFCEEIEAKFVTLPKLLDGNEIMALLNIPPSKRLGEIINELEEAQLSGFVQSKDEALRFVSSCK